MIKRAKTVIYTHKKGSDLEAVLNLNYRPFLITKRQLEPTGQKLDN